MEIKENLYVIWRVILYKCNNLNKIEFDFVLLYIYLNI